MKAINVDHIISIESFDKELSILKYDKDSNKWISHYSDISYYREDLSEKYLIDEDNNVYTKPHIKITLSNNKTESKYFETEIECMEYLKAIFIEINNGERFIDFE